MEEQDVVIVGGGIAGLATAVALKRVGVGALVLEKSEGLRATGTSLGLAPNAWLALHALGVGSKLTATSTPSLCNFITNLDTGAIQEAYFPANSFKGQHGLRVVQRKALLEALAEEVPIDSVRFSSKLKSIENQTQEGSSFAIIHMEDGASIKAKALIGCDGVHSVVARWLGLTAPVNSGRWAVRGMAVFPDGHGLNPEFQQFVTVGKRAGFAPLNDKEIYWFLVCKFSSKGEDHIAHDPEMIKREVTDNLAKDFPPLYLRVVQRSDLSTLTWAPLMFRFPWDLIFGNLSKGNVTVAGDAMHPMTPDLGQGGCAALEDAVVLGRHIGNSIIRNKRLVAGDPLAGALERYAKERRWRAATLITGSYLSGWVQHDGSGWWMKFFRDVIFYRLLFTRIFNFIQYDCGELPCISSNSPECVSSNSPELENRSKIE
ncbi:monooxygenase 2-like isoform X2 [Juglans microcarpa x Juglans regia]|uniref:monooxygenase 2-like isoform X2 n=1 Tax=Juglans microcarpa x Juglans regia TaxID=2249226 RepID=UPI001B7EDD61|nr:monooxygenase 2-like isoform X2 [Juglans microcarpa x Juglans regia]